METASCPILYAAHTNHRRRIGSSQLGLCCKNPTSQLHSLAFFPITSIKNLIFHRKNLLFNVPTAFISPSSSTGDSTSQQLAVLLEVDGVLMDVYRLCNRHAFNIGIEISCQLFWTAKVCFYIKVCMFNRSFRKLGLDCANWTEPVYSDLVRKSAGDEERMLMIYFDRIGWPTSVPTSEKGAFMRNVLREKVLRRYDGFVFYPNA
ncbi:hypothetical protein M9H77_23456 [Catharanthus roseus]|uniref:Uncharacterized protein n=1 Tax=Catharanthus roseus TaxID=4058 RepID=A0ACC0AXH7_CATRO|nr:hypothetical protein M9H77_23456 [Catharanthus roseus]